MSYSYVLPLCCSRMSIKITEISLRCQDSRAVTALMHLNHSCPTMEQVRFNQANIIRTNVHSNPDSFKHLAEGYSSVWHFLPSFIVEHFGHCVHFLIFFKTFHISNNFLFANHSFEWTGNILMLSSYEIFKIFQENERKIIQDEHFNQQQRRIRYQKAQKMTNITKIRTWVHSIVK